MKLAFVAVTKHRRLSVSTVAYVAVLCHAGDVEEKILGITIGAFQSWRAS
jgi:hypothetical protein